MPRKRSRPQSSVLEIESDTPDSIDEFPQHTQQTGEDMSDQFMSSSDDAISDNYLYKHLVNEHKKISKLKRELEKKLMHQEKYALKKPKEQLSQFSVSTFSKVVNVVSASKSDVIDSYGFGCLLRFDKCIVPLRFVQWIAQQVDYKSGDLLFADKVISLTPMSVHSILGLPVGGPAFPTDISAGTSFILQKFNINTLPTVMFFVDKLTLELDSLSEEDIFISFLIVALNTFLCPNSSHTLCPKYLGIFADIAKAKEFDWSGFILGWLLQHIRTFSRGKSSKFNVESTLGGCLYYLAVIYLDFVDFGPRMVSDQIPRISVWKHNMIQTYSQLDLKPNGCYGLRPKLAFNDTCYGKNLSIHNSPHPIVVDDEFLEKLDSVSRCKLPSDLKTSICTIIQKHTLNCEISVELDLLAISNLPHRIYRTLAKLLQHASSIDSRSKDLVLDVMKAITEYPHDDVDHVHSAVQPDQSNNVNSADNFVEPEKYVASHSHLNSPCPHNVTTLSPHVHQPNVVSSKPSPKVPRKSNIQNSPSAVLPSQNKIQFLKVNHSDGNILNENAPISNSPATPIGSSKRVVFPLHAYPSPSPPLALLKKACSWSHHDNAITSKSDIPFIRKPLGDISNMDIDLAEPSHRNTVQHPSDSATSRDVILLGDDDGYVPNSLSPLPRRGYGTSVAEKSTQDSEKENFSPQLTGRTASRVTPNLQSRDRHVRFASSSAMNLKDSSEIQIIGEKTLSQSVRDMTKVADAIYNQKYCSKDSSTGGKLPSHGPRRSVKPAPLFQGNYEIDKKKISLSASELKNYNAICDLAYSDSNRDDVVVVGKVRCTFWALGDSLKPDGFVNSFVMSAFCYNLYLQPGCKPDQSKAHYFFANIGAELMKDPQDANQDILCRAFKRSHRTRPLNHCNNLYFPILFSNHWSVFVVNIKDRNFVFLDSLHHKDHEYQEIIRDCAVQSFQLHWDRYVNVPMDFEEYSFLYPEMPLQPTDNRVDSGIYAMMSLQHWKSPRTVLSKCFDSSDVPRLRIKVANQLLLIPGNTGMKHRVFDYKSKD